MDISRHISYFNPVKNGVPITIIGAGATGSRVFEALVNLGLQDITVFDDEIVETHNLANQLYTTTDIGACKVTGLNQWCHRKLGHPLNAVQVRAKKVEGNMRNHMKGIVFLLTDTMDSRREIAENSLKLNNQVLAVIETRMAISHGNVFCFDPKNLTQYNKWVNTLISDDEGEESACGTSLTVGTTASIIANLAVNHMMAYLTNPDVIPDDITDVFLNPLILNTRTWGTIHG